MDTKTNLEYYIWWLKNARKNINSISVLCMEITTIISKLTSAPNGIVFENELTQLKQIQTTLYRQQMGVLA
jgi:hypothetical protein